MGVEEILEALVQCGQRRLAESAPLGGRVDGAQGVEQIADGARLLGVALAQQRLVGIGVGGDLQIVARSARNLAGVTVLPSAGLNVYDVLHRRNLVMTQDAVQAVTSRLGA